MPLLYRPPPCGSVERRPGRGAGARLIGTLLTRGGPKVHRTWKEAHEPWMDLFLGHISTHFVPGRNLLWYLAFLASAALYLGALDRIRPRAQ